MKPEKELYPALSVRFCGGCNPYFDAEEARKVMEGEIGTPIPLWQPDCLPEICLLIKQCTSDCFSEPELYARRETVFLTRREDVPRIAARIRTLLELSRRSPKAEEPPQENERE